MHTSYFILYNLDSANPHETVKLLIVFLANESFYKLIQTNLKTLVYFLNVTVSVYFYLLCYIILFSIH